MMLDISDAVWLPVLIPVFWIIGLRIAVKLQIPVRLGSALYWWHTLFSLMYYLISSVKISDARGYYAAGQHPDWVIAVGSQFVNFLSGILVSVLGMGCFSTFIVFGFFGYIALLLLAHLLIVYYPEEYGVEVNWRMVYIVLFLPSLSYWSCALGKDALAFLGCCLALFATVDLLRRKWLLFLAIFIMYMVRPQAAMCMLIAIALAILFSSDVTYTFRVFMSLLMVVAMVFLLPYVIQYIGIERKGGDVGGYLAWSQEFGYNGDAGSIVISDMAWPVRLFAYMFRPLFIDAKNVLMLLSSLENMLLLFLFVKCSREIVRIVVVGNNFLFRYAMVYSALMWVMLGNTTTNLGGAFRQKSMFLPALLALLVFAVARSSVEQEPSCCPENAN